MLKVPPLPFLRRRAHRPAPDAPAVLSVVGVTDINYGGDILSLIAVFNTTAENPLADLSGADPTKWGATYSGQAFNGVSIFAVDFNQIEIGFEGGGVTSPPNELRYANDPSDIADTLGRFLAAFSGFPL